VRELYYNTRAADMSVCFQERISVTRSGRFHRR
jgi:hypothetical protein